MDKNKLEEMKMGLESVKEVKDLQNLIIQMFVKKECDINASYVRSALGKSVTGMAKAASRDPELVEKEYISLFELNEEEIKMLERMTSTFVCNAIGYSIIFEDIARAKAAYEADKNTYDQIYERLSLVPIKEQTRTK